VPLLFERGTLVYRANVVDSDVRLLRDSTPLLACSIDTNPGTMQSLREKHASDTWTQHPYPRQRLATVCWRLTFESPLLCEDRGQSCLASLRCCLYVLRLPGGSPASLLARAHTLSRILLHRVDMCRIIAMMCPGQLAYSRSFAAFVLALPQQYDPATSDIAF
jgi:hypothetical protein